MSISGITRRTLEACGLQTFNTTYWNGGDPAPGGGSVGSNKWRGYGSVRTGATLAPAAQPYRGGGLAPADAQKWRRGSTHGGDPSSRAAGPQSGRFPGVLYRLFPSLLVPKPKNFRNIGTPPISGL